MPVKHHVALDRARKTAKNLARLGGITHQQALDQIAREAGFKHWNAMTDAAPASTLPTLLLPGPSLSGGISTASSFGPSIPFFEIDEFRYLEKPENSPAPTLASVEAQARELMAASDRQPGLKIGDWVGKIMREAASRAISLSPTRPYGHSIRPLPMDARMVAEALDPTGAPYEGDTLMIRCPLHDDRNASLRVTGSGQDLRLGCMSGCSHSDIQDRLISRLCEEGAAATAFMKDNDRSRVVAGHAFGKPGVGGAGGSYTLANGKRHGLNVLAMRMLTKGYPLWIDGHVPRGVATLERMLRSALAGHFPISVTTPKDRAHGLWTYEVLVGQDGGYRILVSARQGERTGVNASNSGRFSVVAAETFDKPRQAVDRVLELTRSFETIDPAERARR